MIFNITKCADLYFKIPRPPSVNMLFPSGKTGIRFKSPKYKEWLQKTDNITGYWDLSKVSVKPQKRIEGHYQAMILVERSKNLTGDVESYAKAVMDYFVSRGVTPDDKYCNTIVLTFFEDLRKGDNCHVFFKKVDDFKQKELL